ncbi:MAG: hypothetical protein GX359_07480 [Clostridiales bacterium]|nr:hypothetical protein [Clostridiales bacterium]
MMPISASKNKDVYVVFLTTNTNMGKLIRFFTRNCYNHVALAFHSDLREMYSFARYHVNSPISGGFVVEYPERYLKDNKDVTIKVCKVSVSKEEYDRMKEAIKYFREHRDIMLYNTINAVLSVMNKSLKIKNSFTCIEFVTYLLNIRNVLAIKDLENMLEAYLIYQGSMKAIAKCNTAAEDDYFERRRWSGVIYDTFSHFGKIILRVAYH